MTKSSTILIMAPATPVAVKLMHFPVTRGFQKDSTGLHWKLITRVKAMPCSTRNTMQKLQAIVNQRCVNTRR